LIYSLDLVFRTLELPSQQAQGDNVTGLRLRGHAREMRAQQCGQKSSWNRRCGLATAGSFDIKENSVVLT